MIAVHEQNHKRQGFQPVELRDVTLIAVPDTTEVAADDHVVVFRHLRSLRKVLRPESECVSVKITGCINHRLTS